MNENVKSPDSIEYFVKSLEHSTKLFGRDTNEDTRETDVDPVRRNIISV